MDDKQVSVDQAGSGTNHTKSVNSFRPPVQPVMGSIYDLGNSGQTISKQSSQSLQSSTTGTSPSAPEQFDNHRSARDTNEYPNPSPTSAQILPPSQNPSNEQVQSHQNPDSTQNDRPPEGSVKPPDQQQQQHLNQKPLLQQSAQEQQQPQTHHQQQPDQQPQIAPVPPPPIKPLLTPEQPPNNVVGGDAVKAEQPKQPSTPQKTVVTKVKLSDELNLFDWFRATDIINQIAEKARSSMDSVITTLDPGMKEYLYSGGNINILVIYDKDEIVGSIFDSFQSVFGRATVTSDSQSAPKTATTIKQDYPVKLACGLGQATTIARDKIRKLRLDTSSVPQNQVILAIQPALVQLQEEQSDTTQEIKQDQPIVKHDWFLTYCMIIEDPVLGAILSAYSQFIPLDSNVISMAKDAKFSDEKQYGRLGFPISIDELMTTSMKSSDPNNDDWLRSWSGMDEQQIVRDLSLVLAKTYRRKWNECVGHS